MHHELTHDSIARQIHEKASGSAKARKKVQNLVDYALKRYNERSVLLTQDELDQIRPFRNVINISPEEQKLIHRSERTLQKIARRKRQITLIVIIVLLGMLIFAVYEGLLARDRLDQLEKANGDIATTEKALQKSLDSLNVSKKELANHMLIMQESKDSLKNLQTEIGNVLKDVEEQKILALKNATKAKLALKKANQEAFKIQKITLEGKAAKALSDILYNKAQIKIKENEKESIIDKIFSGGSPLNKPKTKEEEINDLKKTVKQDIKEGIDYCNQLIDLAPSDNKTYILKSEIYFETDKFDKGIEALSEGIQKSDTPRPLYEKRIEKLKRKAEGQEQVLQDLTWLFENEAFIPAKESYLSRILWMEEMHFKRYDDAIKRIEAYLNSSDVTNTDKWEKRKEYFIMKKNDQ